MVGVSAIEEFQLLESVQACASDPDLWSQTLDQIEKTCLGRIYLLELDVHGHHSGRYCDVDAAAELIDYLSMISVREGQSAFEFLQKDAQAFYPYSRSLLDRVRSQSYYQASKTIHEFAIFPGYICTLLRSSERTVLFCGLFDTENGEAVDQNLVLPTFRRLSRAISLSLEVENRLEQVNKRQLALQLILQDHPHSTFLIDTDFGIKISTPACKKLLSDGDVFTAQNDRLVPMRKDVESALLVVTSQITDHLSGNDHGSRHYREHFLTEQSLVSSRSDNRLFRLLVRGLFSEFEDLRSRPDAYILVEVRNQLQLPEDVNSLLRSCFDLSEKEAQLAYFLATTGSLTATLDILGITRNTAKTHLRRIYEKTMTQSQLELSKLLHGLSGLL